MSQTQRPDDTPFDTTVAAIIRAKANRVVRSARLHHQEREDVEQELALHWITRRARFDPARGSWAAFVSRVVDRLARNLVRHLRAAKRDGGTFAPVPADVPDPGAGTSRDGATDVADVLGLLPERVRVVAELLGTETVTAVAERLGLSRATVYARLEELSRRAEFRAFRPPGAAARSDEQR